MNTVNYRTIQAYITGSSSNVEAEGNANLISLSKMVYKSGERSFMYGLWVELVF